MVHSDGNPDLEQIAASQLAACLRGVEVSSPLSIDSSSELCYTLELLIPAILRRTHWEWENESIDGFFFASATKTSDQSADLVGTCILIRDQTVTPFLLNLSLTEPTKLGSVRIRLGEPGGGPLGISGPASTSRAAQELLAMLVARLDGVNWVYDVGA